MATGSIVPFTPLATIAVAASTTAAEATGLQNSDSVLVFNSTGAVAFVTFADTASATSTPVPVGARQLFAGTLGKTASVILASGAGTVYFTAGNGTAY